MMPILAILAAATAQHREPPRPHISAGFDTYNVFWPYDTDAHGNVYPCTYLPTIVLANHTRLIAHGSCARKAEHCNGLHAKHGHHLSTNPNYEHLLCQKHSDDGGATWSPLRFVSQMSLTGQIVWDNRRKVLVAHWMPDLGKTVQERLSFDLGETWSEPRDMSFLIADGPTGDGSNTISTDPGAALQLSPANKHHPHRLVFAGHINRCATFWYTDDGTTYHVSRNALGAPFCVPGVTETALAETPDGGVLSSSRNEMYHGKG